MTSSDCRQNLSKMNSSVSSQSVRPLATGVGQVVKTEVIKVSKSSETINCLRAFLGHEGSLVEIHCIVNFFMVFFSVFIGQLFNESLD